MLSARRSRRLSRVDSAVIDALLPADADERLPVGVLDSGFEAFLDDFARLAAPNLQRGFWISLLAAGWVAPLLVRRLPPLSRLPLGDRGRALEAMERSRLAVLRQLLSVLKTVVSLHYGAVPEVRRAIGYGA